MSRNITLVIHALHGGGAERMAAVLANHWVAQDDRVALVTLDTVDSNVYRVDPRVRRIGLGLMRTSRSVPRAVVSNMQRIRSLRSAISETSPDCVVSLTDKMNILALLAVRPLRRPVVIAEHSDPHRQWMGRVWEQLRRMTYPRCAAAVVLTQSVAEQMPALVGQRPVFIIPNGIGAARFTPSTGAGPQGRTIGAMGRLSVEKGFDLLIAAFARIAPRQPDWQLEIAGEGPERATLQELIQNHHLSGRVRLIGWVDEPQQFFSRIALFVLSSRYEGFPVSLLEAMACGVPVVSFECGSGPGEIVRDQIDGVCVPALDIAALAHAMERLMTDRSLRSRMARRATEVVQRFSEEEYFHHWNKVLQSVLEPENAG